MAQAAPLVLQSNLQESRHEVQQVGWHSAPQSVHFVESCTRGDMAKA
jgi:hypothetical protein